jgi:hypothetical protein
MGGEGEGTAGRPALTEPAWLAAQKIEEWAGEVRVNLVRLVAVAAFYAHHLANVYLFRVDLPAGFHLVMTGVAASWTAAAVVLHAALSRRWNPPFLKYAAVSFDALMATVLLVLSDGPRGPFVALLFLLIATAPMRLQLRLVWTATLLAILAYAFACGHARWVKPEWRVPRTQQGIVVLALAAAGVLAGQAVRQSRRFALDYADRVRPEEPQ